MAQQKTQRQIGVFIGAGDKGISLTRKDKTEWQFPLFVNVPNGTREHIVDLLDKGPREDGTFGNRKVISWDMPAGALEQTIIKTGDNAGKTCLTVTITLDTLTDWLESLVITRKGAVSQQANDAFAAHKAKVIAELGDNPAIVQPETDVTVSPF
jgi:hypothetical protein